MIHDPATEPGSSDPVDSLLSELEKTNDMLIDELALTDREREILQKLVSNAMADRLREETFFRIKESIDHSRNNRAALEEHVTAYRDRVHACAEECERAIVVVLKEAVREVNR